MKFARIQGHGRLRSDENEPILSLVVTLDDGRLVTLVRDESVAWLPFGPTGDTTWQIDQYTQETLGNLLAEEGWEVLSQDETASKIDEDGISHSSIFIARRMGWG